MASKSFKDTLLRGIALLGLIVILVLGAWGIILLAFNLPSFLGSVSDSINGLFTRGDDTTTPEETELPTIVTPTQPITSVRPTTPSTPNQPSYVYTPAPVVPQLYGLPDLKVTILSVIPSGNRYVMQFLVENVGTNSAQSGWSFNAILPINNTGYTYQAPGQQALNPGDKIMYTLGFDRPYYNQPYPYDGRVCTLQYPNYNCPHYPYYYDNQYESYNNYPYHNQPIWNGNRTVTVQLDPYNRIYETSEYNNSANWNLGPLSW